MMKAAMPNTLNRRFSVAPMLNYTDRHNRYLLRLISSHTLLYSEMVTTGALLKGKHPHRWLAFHPTERPLALQLGGSNPQEMAACARLAEDYGYDEANINVGCPSDRVQQGVFGACLMAQPELVAECVAAMRAVASLPVTVKTRIGIDQQDSYAELIRFIETVATAGCQTFIIHARKAWLTGLNPKQNRDIPPLRYDVVYQLKQDWPQLEIIINGGITEWPAVMAHLQRVDGVMVGRAVCQNPYFLAEIDRNLYQEPQPVKSRNQVVMDYLPYIEQQLMQGTALTTMSRHLLGLFQGQPNARQWRRYLSEQAHKKQAGIEVIEAALQQVMV